MPSIMAAVSNHCFYTYRKLIYKTRLLSKTFIWKYNKQGLKVKKDELLNCLRQWSTKNWRFEV